VWAGFVGVVLYRSAEALLNYMEASYEKNGHWMVLHVNIGRFFVVALMSAKILMRQLWLLIWTKEAENDWGAYSAGRSFDRTNIV